MHYHVRILWMLHNVPIRTQNQQDIFWQQQMDLSIIIISQKIPR